MQPSVVIQRLLARERWIMAGALFLAVTGSGGYILAGGGTGMASLAMVADSGPLGALISGAPDMIRPMVWTPFYGLVIFVMWWLMMIAMMVPSAAPTILLYGALNRAHGTWGMLEFLCGYLAVWAGFSLAATAVQGVLALGGMISAMYMNLATPFLGGLALVGAGLYQLTPMKRACLAHCRGPVVVLTRHRRSGRLAALRLGAVHGSYCLGCCWGLMALLFVGGVMNLWWILGLMFYVAVEKLAPGGDRFAVPLAALLIVGGVALLFRSAGVI